MELNGADLSIRSIEPLTYLTENRNVLPPTEFYAFYTIASICGVRHVCSSSQGLFWFGSFCWYLMLGAMSKNGTGEGCKGLLEMAKD
jgi:hypothetical protein